MKKNLVLRNSIMFGLVFYILYNLFYFLIGEDIFSKQIIAQTLLTAIFSAVTWHFVTKWILKKRDEKMQE